MASQSTSANLDLPQYSLAFPHQRSDRKLAYR
jgi:hypothetical protein